MVGHSTDEETMAPDQNVEMTDREVDEFLGSHETGVLALAGVEEPYAIPISYGYDAGERTLYMRLVSTPESEKRAFLSSTPQARLVVYDDLDDTYRSVVVHGELEEISPDELTPDDIAQYGEAKRPLFEIWADSKRDLTIELYRLDATEITGRRVTIDRE